MQSAAQTGAALVGVVCITAAFLLGRYELVLVGAPLLIAALVDHARLLRGITVPTISLHAAGLAEDAPTSTAARAAPTLAAEAPTEGTYPAGPSGVGVIVAVRGARASGGDAVQLRLVPADREPFDVVLAPRTAEAVRLRVVVGHSGPQRVLAAVARVIGADASWAGPPGALASLNQVVRPATVALRSLPLAARLVGLTGQHLSSRPGEGGEFRDVDRYRPGDRLRRIDWKATARRGQRPGELFVRRTTATSDLAVQLVLDARDDLPAEVADWWRPYPHPGIRSLDIAREAAASLATAYAATADRVGFDDLADASRALPPRAGRRHREAVLRAIATTAARGSATERVRVPRLATGALVYVLSTFLDDQPVRLALAWRAAGHRVIAVDVLPAPVLDGLPDRERVALRLVEAERAVRRGRLAAAGVEALPWTPESRDVVLRQLTAPAARRRAERSA